MRFLWTHRIAHALRLFLVIILATGTTSVSLLAVSAGVRSQFFCSVSPQTAQGGEDGEVKGAISVAEQFLYTQAGLDAEADRYATGQVPGIIHDADWYLTQTLPKITDKPQVPPSGDKRDYISWPRYLWYNAQTGQYEYRDGQPNPLVDEYVDEQNFAFVQRYIYHASLAWLVTGKQKYADAALSAVRTWFITNSTRMSPDLRFAQWDPRDSLNGRTINMGVIVLHGGYELWNVMPVVRAMGGLTTGETTTLNNWMTSLRTWLATDPAVLAGEGTTHNNHQIYWHLNMATLAHAVGDQTTARQQIEIGKQLINNQILPSGELPYETERTLALDYSHFALVAFMGLARLGAWYGVDLWHYTGPQGQSLAQSFAFYRPYAVGEKAIPWQQIAPPDKVSPYYAYQGASTALGSVYSAAATQIANNISYLIWRSPLWPPSSAGSGSGSGTASLSAGGKTKASPTPTPTPATVSGTSSSGGSSGSAGGSSSGGSASGGVAKTTAPVGNEPITDISLKAPPTPIPGSDIPIFETQSAREPDLAEIWAVIRDSAGKTWNSWLHPCGVPTSS